MRYITFVKFFIVSIFLSGCASQSMPDLGSVFGGNDSDTEATDQAGAETSGSGGQDGLAQGEEFDDFNQIEEQLEMVIYFDFDQSDLRAEYADILQGHSERLSNDRRARIRLDGHADERGSREYNIGLGERRSQAVRRLLLVQGASSDQISTVSYGEERPAAFGGDEESWQLNRRVEITYLD